MTTPTEAYKAGRLADATAAAIEQVRNHPADRGKRFFLAELFLFAGDLERADKQLDVLFQPDAPDLVWSYPEPKPEVAAIKGHLCFYEVEVVG